MRYSEQFMEHIKYAFHTFSFFDSGNAPSKTEPERFHGVEATTKGLKEPNPSVCFYHGFVLGLMVDLSDRYRITSNRESGFGRYDVMLEPKDKTDKAFILEFKVHDPDLAEKTLDALHPRGHMVGPPGVFSVPIILKYSGKNHIKFPGNLENFYFRSIFYCKDNSENRQKILFLFYLI